MNIEVKNLETKTEEVETEVVKTEIEEETRAEEVESKIEEKTKPVSKPKLSRVREFAYLDGLRGLASFLLCIFTGIDYRRKR